MSNDEDICSPPLCRLSGPRVRTVEELLPPAASWLATKRIRRRLQRIADKWHLDEVVLKIAGHALQLK
jgi:hypothetical protein